MRPFTSLNAPSARLAGLAQGAYRDKPESAIRGTGYVVDSLEAALWCFHRAGTYREAVLLATNLGEDADTTAAVVGQIAGAHYGKDGIPEAWRAKLARRQEIVELADRLLLLSAQA